MSPLYIFAFIIHGVFSTTTCKDGVQIVSTETKNPEDLLGNWTYVYHWDPKIKGLKDGSDDDDQEYYCPQVKFEAITPELVKAKEAECAKYKIPFNWADAKLTFAAPFLKIKDAVIIIGEKENWIAVDCIMMGRVLIKKVSDDYAAIIIAGDNSQSELLVREPPPLDKLKCIAHNVDVGKGISGFGVCF